MRGRHATADKRERVLALRAQGLTIRVIAERLGIAVSTVSKILASVKGK